jgi:osmoprotectant transport system ATP-binding protein
LNGIVEFRNVSYSVGNQIVLRNFTLEVGRGEMVVLLGRSGAGKTSALKMVNALRVPESGMVVVEGRPVAEWDVIRLRRRIGYVIQEVGLFPHLTIERNIGLIPALEGWSHERLSKRVRLLLDLLGMSPDLFLHRRPHELSGGQRQRVGVARALAIDPPILLFDEPFGAVDPVTRHDLQELLLKLTRQLEKTALFVTHDVREALRLASRIALVHEGRLAMVSTPDDFLHSDHREARAFLASLDYPHAE